MTIFSSTIAALYMAMVLGQSVSQRVLNALIVKVMIELKDIRPYEMFTTG